MSLRYLSEMRLNRGNELMHEILRAWETKDPYVCNAGDAGERVGRSVKPTSKSKALGASPIMRA